MPIISHFCWLFPTELPEIFLYILLLGEEATLQL